MTKPPAPARNRLSQLVHRPGGISRDEAIRDADANLQAIRDAVVCEIDSNLARIQAVGAGLEGPDERAFDELHDLGNSVFAKAGAFGMTELSEVSFSLCDLVDRLRTGKRWDAAALQVHLDSLRLMRAGGADSEEQRKAVIAALRRVAERL